MAAPFLAKTGKRGVLVTANATFLSAKLAIGASEMSINLNPFSNGDSITIDTEEILIGTAGKTSTITKAQDSTSDLAHPLGQAVYNATGVTVLTHTIGASELLAAIRCSSPNIEMVFGIDIGGTLYYTAATTPNAMELFFPFTAVQLAVSTVITVYAWLFADHFTDYDNSGGESIARCWLVQ